MLLSPLPFSPRTSGCCATKNRSEMGLVRVSCASHSQNQTGLDGQGTEGLSSETASWAGLLAMHVTALTGREPPPGPSSALKPRGCMRRKPDLHTVAGLLPQLFGCLG